MNTLQIRHDQMLPVAFHNFSRAKSITNQTNQNKMQNPKTELFKIIGNALVNPQDWRESYYDGDVLHTHKIAPGHWKNLRLPADCVIIHSKLGVIVRTIVRTQGSRMTLAMPNDQEQYITADMSDMCAIYRIREIERDASRKAKAEMEKAQKEAEIKAALAELKTSSE